MKIAKVAVSAATYWVDRPYDYIIPEELAEQVVPGVRVIVPFARGNRREEGLVLALAEDSVYDRQKLKLIQSALDSEPVLTDGQIKLVLWMRERFFCTVYEALRAILPVGVWYQFSESFGIAEGIEREAAYELAGRSKLRTAVLDLLYDKGGDCDLSELEHLGEGVSRALRELEKQDIIRRTQSERQRARDKTVRRAVLAIPVEEAQEQIKRRRRAKRQAEVIELLCNIGSATAGELSYFTGATSAVLKKLASDGIITLEDGEVLRRPIAKATGEREPLPVLNETQQAAYRDLLALLDTGEPRAALLFGVTGSGKTAVYIHTISDMLRRGKSSILLVPEIALTPQMLETFTSYFGDEIAVLHSSLAIGERYDEWKRVRRGEARVVIGTRSAVFAPVRELGLIIMDEEQERTYKSENSPRYHAREVAKYLCTHAGATLLLGSATPDIDTRFAAETGRYSYIELRGRYNLMDLPAVEIVDMKRELRQGNGGSISERLLSELQVNVGEGKQSILFLNRRGTNKLVTCADCGHVYECPRCSVSLTYHSATGRLNCHYCGFSQLPGENCPVCGGILHYVGAGTQKLVQELDELLPGVDVLRMDTDTVTPAGSHDTLIRRFIERKIPIMVGTQMVTKGLNFENVTLVGVISADQALYSGDYRAAERTFSLITQVVGRSGRGESPGRAVIQTFTPENQTIFQASMQDYDSFYRSELELRRLQNSPPFAELFCLTAIGGEESAVLRCCTDIRRFLERAEVPGARVLGPAPLPVLRVNNRYRYRVTLVCEASKQVRELIAAIVAHCGREREYRGISVFADIDPD